MSARSETLLVIGTGRCGTRFFAEGIRNTGREAHHESMNRKLSDRIVRRVGHARILTYEGAVEMLERGCSLVGFPFVLFVERLRAVNPQQRVICLHREQSAFAKSAKRYFSMSSPMNPFPRSRTWERYWQNFEDAMAKISEPVRHIQLHELDDLDFESLFYDQAWEIAA